MTPTPRHPDTPTPSSIAAVIFDMDGLLIDSEPLWRIAEVEALTAVGVPITEREAMETTGLRTDEVVELWHGRYPWPSRRKRRSRRESSAA